MHDLETKKNIGNSIFRAELSKEDQEYSIVDYQDFRIEAIESILTFYYVYDYEKLIGERFDTSGNRLHVHYGPDDTLDFEVEIETGFHENIIFSFPRNASTGEIKIDVKR